MDQSEFARALIDIDAEIPQGISPISGPQFQSRFNVYRNNIFVTLIDALQESYPVVAALVGEAFFKKMARGFAIEALPKSPVMAFYGEHFAEFVSQFEPASTLPYLPDIAKLEWQRILSLHCADFDSLNTEDFERLLNDPDHLAHIRLYFNPSVALINSNYAIGSLWEAHQEDSEEDVIHALNKIHPSVPESILVLRHGLGLIMKKLSPGDAAFMTEITHHNTLANAIQKAEESAQFDFAQMMAMLISYGAFVKT